jgi:Xaa-Pro aminopeptidase
VPDSPAFPSQYRGIGIRIEDNILIGKQQPVVLSSRAPKQVAELEQILAEKCSDNY